MTSKPLALTLAVAAAVALAATFYVGARPVGMLPPLGALLDPAHGAWANAEDAVLRRTAMADIPGLAGPVDVRYDARGVPHIFATTEEDAYRALGYVVARDRLFQLDIQTRAATGRLTELVGPVALDADETTRQLGMPRAAELKFAALDPNGTSRRTMDAYAAGINAYIDGLPPADYPIEYKLLHVRPERWQAVNSIHLLNRMAYTLAAESPEQTLIHAAAVVGEKAAESVFPAHTPIEEPIQPVPGWTGPRN
ncbi:MAG: penicillin acylase family protein, partial [Gemmatimonadaceae bacterium]